MAGVEEGLSMYDILLDDLIQDMEQRLAEFYGEALAPVLIRAMAELAAETALKFLHLDDHLSEGS